MKKQLRILLISILISILTISVLAGTIFSASEQYHVPMVKNKYGSSTNWAGYAVTGSSVTDVKGSWIVPGVTCPTTSNQYSSFWVGIDGYNSGTVEQIGTESDCNNGNPSYYAWFEFYPKSGYYIPISVKPGDIINAEVKYIGRGQYNVSILDYGPVSSQFFSYIGKMSQAQRSSAEWITEAPWSGGILPLANFGIADFGLDYTRISNTNYATINGITGNISTFGSAVTPITMVSYSGITKAAPSSLSDDGTSFNTTWFSTGP